MINQHPVAKSDALDRREMLCGLLGGAVAAAAALSPTPASASWPPSNVRFVVPFGPGGVPDVAARLIAEAVAKSIGTSVVVENRPGSGGTNGVVSVVRSEPDGATFIVCTSAFILNKVLNEQLPYETTKSLTPICEIANAPNLFVTRAALGVRTLSEFIELGRTRPEGLSYASPGLGTTPQVSAELLGARAKIRLVHVPYNNAPQGVQDLISGVVQSACMAVPLMQPHVQSGALRALAVTSPKRWRDLPATPTMREAGFDNFETDTLLLLAGPAGLSPEIVHKLAGVTQAALNTPEIRATLERAGLDVVAGGPGDLAKRIAKDDAMWREVVRSISPVSK